MKKQKRPTEGPLAHYIKPGEIQAIRSAYALRRRECLPWHEIAPLLARTHRLVDRRGRPYHLRRLRRLVGVYEVFVAGRFEFLPWTIFGDADPYDVDGALEQGGE